MPKFTDEQRGRMLNATFEIAEMMEELDCYGQVMTPSGPATHPNAQELDMGIAFILSDFEDKEQEEIAHLVNHQRGVDEDSKCRCPMCKQFINFFRLMEDGHCAKCRAWIAQYGIG